MPQNKTALQRRLLLALRDAGITVLILLLTTLLCMLLDEVGEASSYASLLYVLSVLVISRLTNGYLFGILASIAAMFGVNYIFTYPYLAFNFTIEGYPLTFLCFLIVSILTSAMTTRIKQAERLRIEAERERMRANLLRAISHDLRTPLTAIVGSANAILDNDSLLGNEERRKLLQNVVADAEWLIRMVENLLSITRVGVRDTKLNTKLEAPEEIVGEAVRIDAMMSCFRPAVRKFKKRFPQLPISVSVPDEMLLVPMDALLILQVLNNLLENAAIHGERVSHIELRVTHAPGEAVFTIADDGVGIADAAFPHLFDGYLQVSPERKTVDNQRSMGIGLSVCRTIIQAHGGKLTARNRPEGGAEFRFSLPCEEMLPIS